MQNLYEIIKGSLFFNKFVLDDLICVEYTCPLNDMHLGIFTQFDYIIHVLSGKKRWKTIDGEWTVEAGETLFVKKGAAIITQNFDDDFCMLGFFLPDNLIRESLLETIRKMPVSKNNDDKLFTATKLKHDNYLDGFFQSMLSYFRTKQQPPDSILKLKLKELLINIIYNCNNPQLKSYLKSMIVQAKPLLSNIMESNFCFNLKIEEFAKMSNRSLSAFKRDFCSYYNTSPGKWLLVKRLDYAANLLSYKASNISDVAFKSGFEDVSHFSRSFKNRFNKSPSEYRKVALQYVVHA